jgi:hypothetical protein
MYHRNVGAANSEATRCFDFLNFLKEVLAGISAGYTEKLSPQLERHLKIKRSSVLVRIGRIDALLGNLILEFKVAVDPARVDAARSDTTRMRAHSRVIW